MIVPLVQYPATLSCHENKYDGQQIALQFSMRPCVALESDHQFTTGFALITAESSSRQRISDGHLETTSHLWLSLAESHRVTYSSVSHGVNLRKDFCHLLRNSTIPYSPQSNIRICRSNSHETCPTSPILRCVMFNLHGLVGRS